MDKTKALLCVTCLVLAGVVVWQQSSDVTTVASRPPQPLRIAPPAPSATTAPAANAPAASPAVKVGSAAPKKTAPRREVRPAPAAATSRAAAEVPAPEPVAAAPTPAPAPEAVSADAYESQAAARLQQGNYREAGELYETAVRSGGKATFTVVHDHSKGNFEKDPKASCVGELIVTTSDIKFDGVGAADSHHFEATWAEVIEAGSNKFFGSGIGGFHVAINPDGKYKNINLAPRSKDKAEAKMIIDLLNASARGKTERGSK